MCDNSLNFFCQRGTTCNKKTLEHWKRTHRMNVGEQFDDGLQLKQRYGTNARFVSIPVRWNILFEPNPAMDRCPRLLGFCRPCFKFEKHAKGCRKSACLWIYLDCNTVIYFCCTLEVSPLQFLNWLAQIAEVHQKNGLDLDTMSRQAAHCKPNLEFAASCCAEKLSETICINWSQHKSINDCTCTGSLLQW